MAWIDKNENETASQLAARLTILGAKIETAEEKSTSIVSACSNYALRQMTVVKSYEYRGLTKAAAVLLRGLDSDGTTNAVLYAAAKTNGMTKSEYVSASVQSGTSVKVSASRADESGKWVARVTETTHSYSGSGWSSTVPARSSAGITKSVTYRHELKRFCVKGVLLGSKTIKTVTTVKEYPYKTSNQADALCANPVDTMAEHTVTYAYNSEFYDFTYTTGTTKTFEKRFVNDDEGWTVTETETVASVVVPQN